MSRKKPKAKAKGKPRKQKTKLTALQEKFAQHFAVHDSPEGAYQAAGYATSRLSPERISQRAADVLQNAAVLTRIIQLRTPGGETTTDKTHLEARLRAFLHDVIFADPADYLIRDGDKVRMKLPFELTLQQGRVIDGFKITTGKTPSIKVTLLNQQKALRMLANYYGLSK